MSASREVKQGVEFKTSLSEWLRDNATSVGTLVPSRTHINVKTPEARTRLNQPAQRIDPGGVRDPPPVGAKPDDL